mgnify:FL=1
MIYVVALSFFLVGLITGYVFAEIFDKNEEYLSLTRKNLEMLLIESNITEEILKNKKAKEELEG